MASSNYYVDGYTPPAGVTDKDAVVALQRQLNAKGANLALDGVYGPKTQAAYQGMGLSQLGADLFAGMSDRQRRDYNNQFLSQYGISGDVAYPVYDANYNWIDRGAYGADGTGGVFSPYGYSSNPNYLYQNAGVTRAQANNTVLRQLSDKAIVDMIGTTVRFADDLFIDPITGAVSSGQESGMIPMRELRQAYAQLTGQQTNNSGYGGGTASAFVNPAWYTPQELQQGLGALQSQWLSGNDPYGTGLGVGLASRDMGAWNGAGYKGSNVVDEILDDTTKKRYEEEIRRLQREIFGRVL